MTQALNDDPLIREHPGTLPFWQAAAEGRFVLPTCRACGKAHWYPRPFCPLCASPDIEWRAASGRGTLYASTRMPRATPPVRVAYVQLAEGPIMLTNLVDVPDEAAVIGRALTVRFVESDGARRLPMFTLA